jgi:multidrug efflux pump subunit AcrA (membrane-fusion protein)
MSYWLIKIFVASCVIHTPEITSIVLKGSKKMKIKNGFLCVIVLLALGLAGCEPLKSVMSSAPTNTPVVPVVQDDSSVIVEGNIVPLDSARIYSRTGGTVNDVLAKKGDPVAKDAVLVLMDAREQVEAALAAAKFEETSAQQALDTLNDKAQVARSQAYLAMLDASNALIDAQQKLDDFDNDQYTTDLDNAKTDAQKAKDDLKDAQDEFDKYKDLDTDNANYKSSKTKLDDAQKKYDDLARKRDLLVNKMDSYKAAVDAAQATYDDAFREYDNRKNGPDPDELALAQSRLDNARAQVAAAQAAVDDLEIKAPLAGTVVEMELDPGEILLPGQQIALVADLSEWYVETSDLTEMDVVNIKEGQKATIKPDALPELKLPATVTEIAQSAGKKGGDVTYTVRLKLDETDPALRWGMTVEVRFE